MRKSLSIFAISLTCILTIYVTITTYFIKAELNSIREINRSQTISIAKLKKEIAELRGNASSSVNNTIELTDLIKLFLLPQNTDYNAQDWMTGAEKGQYPINWVTDGVKSEGTNALSMRSGTAIVTIGGKYIRQLSKYIEPVPWVIQLIGAHTGFYSFIINCPIVSYDLLGFSFEDELKVYKIPYKKLSQAIYSEKYEVSFPNAKTCWINCDYSEGSGGHSIELKVFLNKEDFMKSRK